MRAASQRKKYRCQNSSWVTWLGTNVSYCICNVSLYSSNRNEISCCVCSSLILNDFKYSCISCISYSSTSSSSSSSPLSPSSSSSSFSFPVSEDLLTLGSESRFSWGISSSFSSVMFMLPLLLVTPVGRSGTVNVSGIFMRRTASNCAGGF